MKYCPNPECPGQLQPGVRPEFVDDADLCSDCGTLLVYEAIGPREEAHPVRVAPDPVEPIIEEATFVDEGGGLAQGTEPEGGPWVAVEVGLLPQEAHVVRGLLETNGIPAELRDEHTIAANTLLLNALRGVKVVVQEADLERAQDLLAAIEAESSRTPAVPEDDDSAPEPPKA